MSQNMSELTVPLSSGRDKKVPVQKVTRIRFLGFCNLFVHLIADCLSEFSDCSLLNLVSVASLHQYPGLLLAQRAAPLAMQRTAYSLKLCTQSRSIIVKFEKDVKISVDDLKQTSSPRYNFSSFG